MKFKLGRRVATVAAVAALTAGGLGMAAGNASAFGSEVWLSGPHGVGIYNQANTWNGKTAAADLSPSGDSLDVDCWTSGQQIDNLGTVWYHVNVEHHNWDSWWQGYWGWAYGGYVDGNWAYYNMGIPHC